MVGGTYLAKVLKNLARHHRPQFRASNAATLLLLLLSSLICDEGICARWLSLLRL